MMYKEYYKKSVEIIKANKKIIILFALIYIISLAGSIIYNKTTYIGFSSVEDKDAYFQVMKEVNLHENFFVNFFKILWHNIIASLFRIIGGILLAIIPIFLLIDGGISNGYALVASAIDEGLRTTLLLFLPHNLFEIPASILSSSFGLIMFLALFKEGNRIVNLKSTVIESLIVFLFWIFPLLLLAGIIESIIIVTYWF